MRQTQKPAQFNKKPLPILQGILPLDKNRVMPEILAGMTLAALSIPEVMGYTKISGTPVVTGLYTILIPAFLFALFGSSRHLVVGADSATAAILAAGLAGMAMPGSNEYVALAAALALICAGLLILARIIGLGFMADFLSRTVLIGFLTGVGIQVALSSIAGILGLKESEGGVFQIIINDFGSIGQTNLYTLSVSIAVIGLILGLKKFSQKIPGALIAIVSATAASWALNLAAHGVHVLGEIPKGLPAIGLPHVPWSMDLVMKLLPIALAMFVVILAQSAATSRAYAAMYNEQFSENADLMALCIANIGASLSGTFVVNGSPTKTQMVTSSGGRSQLACITMSLLVLLVLLFLTAPLAFMPAAVLSAVVFLIGIELVDIRGMRQIWSQRPSEFWVALATAVVVVLVGVEQGIIFAMMLSLMDHVRRSYQSKNTIIAIDPTGSWRSLPVSTPKQIRPGLMIYRFAHTMYYANAQQLSIEVGELTRQASPHLSWFCIDASAIADIDFTAAETLRSLCNNLSEGGIRLVWTNVIEPVKIQLDHYGLVDLFGKNAFYETINAVLDAYNRNSGII